MPKIGAFAAKTHLSQLLERVQAGERFTITRRGKPVALLVPPETTAPRAVARVVDEMLLARDQNGPTLGQGLTIRQLVEEGRRR